MNNNRVYLIAFTTALSGFLFGFDAGVISGAILFIKQNIVINEVETGLIVSAVPIGALFSSIISGKCSDIYGRKKLLFVTAMLFLIGTLCCSLANSVNLLFLGRFILGTAIGFGSCVSPVYVSELAHPRNRGKLVNMYVVAIQAGIFIAFLVGYLLSDTGAWRLMIGLGAIPAVILALCTLALDESPRWLILKNKNTQARLVLSKMLNKNEIDETLYEIKKTVNQTTLSFREVLQKKYLGSLFIGISISFFTQTIGINAIQYYAPTLFQNTGFATAEKALFATMFIGLTLTLSTIASLFFIDKIGRRNPLLIGMCGIITCLAILVLTFNMVTQPLILAWTMLLCSIVFMLCHGLSVGPACFLIPSELFPTHIRGFAMGISVAFNWGANVLIALLFPIGMVHYSIASLFTVFLVLSIIGLVIFYYFVPETKGLTLEKIESNLERKPLTYTIEEEQYATR